ncbi:MAG TPA: N-acetylmuramic acid 6-phosphate etherase [Polyangia bacterium]
MPRARSASAAPPAEPEAAPAVDYAALPTEAINPRSDLLDTLPAEEVVKLMADEEAITVRAVKAASKEIAAAAKLAAERLAEGGRMIYVGAGTSGRLGTLDAAECVPTFGIPPSLAVAIMAGGPAALTDAVEGAEDNARDGEQRMRRAGVGPKDCVLCIAASGSTPFVRSALAYAHFRRASTVFITCRKLPPPPPGEHYADVVIELATGPEVIAGSTRLKAGTATKITLNTISTTAYVLLGKTYGGLMVDVRPTNAKLRARATRIVRMLSGLDEKAAAALLEKAGGRAKVALVMHHARVPATRARELLVQHRGSLRAIVGDLDLRE